MTLPEDDRISPPGRGDDGAPDIADPPVGLEDGGEGELRSLRDDVEALIEGAAAKLEAGDSWPFYVNPPRSASG